MHIFSFIARIWRIWSKGFMASSIYSFIFTCLGLLLAYIHPIFLPLMSVIIIYPAYLFYVFSQRFKNALKLILLWAFILSITIILFSYHMPEYASKIIINGEKYRNEMFLWIKTGEGAEGDYKLFLIPKIKELILFSFLAFITMGFAALLLGAYLLNYMNYYVGTLLLYSKNNLTSLIFVALFSWPIYAILRVFGYIGLGISLTYLSYTLLIKLFMRKTSSPSYIFKKNIFGKTFFNISKIKNILLFSLILIVLDFILKATIANAIYQPILHQNTIIP